MSWLQARSVACAGTALLAFSILLLPACSRSDRAPVRATPGAGKTPPPPLKVTPEPIGEAIVEGQPPWIAHLTAVDLDRDGRLDVVFCEARENKVKWLRQVSPGRFTEQLLADNMSAPVHVEAGDIDRDGDTDLVVSSMGVVFPNNDRIGTVFILENDGNQHFTPHAVLENTFRVTDARPADLDGDGDIDLALAQFGYDQGQVSWLERTGPWEFKMHVLQELSGAINVCVADFDGDSRPDIAALISQQWEEIYWFRNRGNPAVAGFETNRIFGSTNEDFGSSGLSVADMNRDGRPDLVYSNGDGFGPAATPGPRPWHGLQWLENTGGNFITHRVGDLPGAYHPIGVDLDRDGATDIIAVAAYADWNNANRNVISLMWFRNDGRMNFTPHVLARSPKDLITVAAGDFLGDGSLSLVTGGFYIYPPFDDISRVMLWKTSAQP